MCLADHPATSCRYVIYCLTGTCCMATFASFRWLPHHFTPFFDHNDSLDMDALELEWHPMTTSGGSANMRHPRFNGVLVFFHCPSNEGFAIKSLEAAFFEMARRLTGSIERVHFAYPLLKGGHPEALPVEFKNVLQFDPRSRDPRELRRMENYVRAHRIELALGFDQPPYRSGYSALRKGGVRRFVSYWGAPMSSINSGLRLALRRMLVWASWRGPDHYIFESEAMRRTGVSGRGLAMRKTSVVYLGVDSNRFRPSQQSDDYAHRTLRIPRERAIIFYSGHMEARKGIAVLVRAAVHLVDVLGVTDVHFVLCGNRESEADRYMQLADGTRAVGHITFAGYRSDIAELMRCSSIGTIASSGWDSFTMSAVEMASSGLPLVVSDLQGLAETVEDGVSGLLFRPGDAHHLAEQLSLLLRDPDRREQMGQMARKRVLDRFTLEQQISSLCSACVG